MTPIEQELGEYILWEDVRYPHRKSDIGAWIIQDEKSLKETAPDGQCIQLIFGSDHVHPFLRA